MPLLPGSGAVALATFNDVRRRPGILLATFAVGVLLLLLPDICARAVEDSASLAFQAALSSAGLFLLLVAGFSGLRAAAREGDLAAAAEWRVTPLSLPGYAVGRFAGVLLAVLLLLAALAPFGLVTAISAARDQPIATGTCVLALAGIVAVAAQFASIGLLLAAWATPQLATILLVATLVGSRVLVPELARQGGAAALAASILPDPTALDLSRELAFGRPIPPGPTLLALAATLLQTAAFVAFASLGLARRED